MKTESIPSTLSKIYHLDFYILALGTGPDLKKIASLKALCAPRCRAFIAGNQEERKGQCMWGGWTMTVLVAVSLQLFPRCSYE